MVTAKQPADSSAIRLTAHAPEHHQRGKPVTLACGCCCCCCCCLHSVGSLIGGIIGSVKQVGPPPVPDDSELPPLFRRPRADTRITTEPIDPVLPSPFRRDLEEKAPLLSVGALYWLLLCFLLFLGSIWFCLVEQRFGPETFFIGLLIGLGLLPLPQLGASILSAIAAALFYEDRRAALARVGYITLFSVIGTVIGIGVMLLFIPFMR